MKKENAIVFIVNREYLFALSAMLINLQSNNTNTYDDIVVYSDNLSEVEQEKLRSIESNIKFINYSLENWINDHKNIQTPQAQSFLEKYTHLAWSKYKVFEQLEFYQKILFLDLDMLIKKDIIDLFSINTGIAWRSGQNFHGKFGNKKNLIEKISSVPMHYPSPNGGLLYATDTINFKKFCKDARDFTVQFLDYFASGLDELAIAWSAFKNEIPIHELNESEYNTLPSQYNTNTKILHFMGEEKLWNNELLQTVFPEWINFHHKTVTQTGFDSKKVIIHEKLGNNIRRKLNEIRWFNLLKNKDLSIPKYLNIEFNFSNEWLILNYLEDNYIYYEFKFSQFQSGYATGLWIKNKFYLNDKGFLASVNALVENSNYIHKIIDKRGIYLYTNKVTISELPALFNYFIKTTHSLITY